MEGELVDWEVVHGSDTESTDSNKKSGVIDDGMILTDHFSSDYVPGVMESGDYGSEPRLNLNESGEVKVSDSEAAQSETVDEDANVSDIEDLSKSCSDSGILNGEEEEIISESGAVPNEATEVDVVNSGDEGKGRETVWWKMPFALLKYCAFKISPVWSLSMAAALMGFLLLGRRLYNMKNKAQSFHLKVTIDDKKASRVMSQAARLNEVFREVIRVPVIRPALPSPGAWPVLSLR